MVNEHIVRKTCPILKKCRKEAFFAPMAILAMVLLALFAVYGFYAAKISILMRGRIFGAVFGVLCIFLMAFNIVYRSIGLRETAKYLESLSPEAYEKLASQMYITESDHLPVYLLDEYLFAPSAPIVAEYSEITDCKIMEMRTNGAHSGYRIKLYFRGIKREINLNGFQKFDPVAFKNELNEKIITTKITKG